MEEKDQANAESIEKRLKMAFSEGVFEAYNKLRKVTWAGEPVDVYAAEIRRLAGLVGYTGRSLKKTVKMAFLSNYIFFLNFFFLFLTTSSSSTTTIDKSALKKHNFNL